METLNQARLHILLQEYFTTDTVLSTSEVNYKEPVVFSKLLLSFLQSFLIPHANKVVRGYIGITPSVLSVYIS